MAGKTRGIRWVFIVIIIKKLVKYFPCSPTFVCLLNPIMDSSFVFQPLMTSTLNNGDLKNMLCNVSVEALENSVEDMGIMEDSVEFVKQVEIITLDESFDNTLKTIPVEDTIVIDDTVEYVLVEDSPTKMVHIQNDTYMAMNVTDESVHSNDGSVDTLGDNSGYIVSCPVHNHHKDDADSSVCPSDPPCNCF